jgi:RNA polymerase sigma-70 factor (ECF subfamily)
MEIIDEVQTVFAAPSELGLVHRSEEAKSMSSCAIQRFEGEVPFSQPCCFSGSRKSIRNTIVRAETCADADGLSAFLSARAHLFGIAYRILRSAAEAEDIVQDVWIRWQTTNRSAVRDAAAFLATTTRRLAINVIQSARSRRETSVGSSSRESVDTCPDPELEAAQSEALRNAVLLLLEKLSPAERAVYVLREAFDYSYREIANILCLEEANTRQLVTRARQRVADGQHAAVNSAEQRCFSAAFVAAAQKGALTKLESFLVGSADGRLGRTNGQYGLGRRSSSPSRCLAIAGHCGRSLMRKWRNPDKPQAQLRYE